MATDDFPTNSPLVGYELSNTRQWLVMIGVVALLMLIITGMGFYIAHLNSLNTRLANNRIMYAFPDEDGVLVSSRRRPTSMVKRYARDFVSNRYTYDPATAVTNFKRAAKMVEPNKAVGLARKLHDLSARIDQNQLSQKLTILSESELIEQDGSYIYAMRGRVERYVATTFDRKYRVKLVVKMNKVTPTESRREGLWVSGLQETKL